MWELLERSAVFFDWAEANQVRLGLAFVVALIPAGYVVWQRSRREQARYREALAILGFDFERRVSGPLEDVGLDPEVQRLSCLHVGESSRQDLSVAALMRLATADGEELLFELKLDRSDPNHRGEGAKWLRAFAVRRRGAALPVFLAEPQGTVGRQLTSRGLRDGLDLEAWPEFSKKYRLSGEDYLAVEALFTHRAAELLSRKAGWIVQGVGDWVLVLRALSQARPGRIREFVDEGRQIAAALVAR